MKNTETLVAEPYITNSKIAEQETLPREDVDIIRETLPDQKEVGHKIREEFKALWDIYEGRRNGSTMHYGNTTIEDDVIATRYLDGDSTQHAIEEVYWRTSLTGPNQKDGTNEMIFVNILSPGEDEYQICVTENNQTKVLRRHPESKEWRRATDDEAEDTLSEFFHRTLIAADTHSRRTPEEKIAADNDARKLLLERYPVLADKKSSTE